MPSLFRRFRRDHGATLVEYAMGVALICVVSIGSLQFVSDGASDELADRSERGAPDLEQGVDGGGTTDSGTTDGSDSSDSGPEPTEVFFGGFEGITTKLKKEKGVDKSWSATLDVQVNDALGAGVVGARVVGRWTYVSGGVTTVVDTTCDQTDHKGECRFQISELPISAQNVTFEMIDIDGGVPPVEYNGAVQSTVINKP